MHLSVAEPEPRVALCRKHDAAPAPNLLFNIGSLLKVSQTVICHIYLKLDNKISEAPLSDVNFCLM
jgi:hypothetical protein